MNVERLSGSAKLGYLAVAAVVIAALVYASLNSPYFLVIAVMSVVTSAATGIAAFRNRRSRTVLIVAVVTVLLTIAALFLKAGIS